VTVLVGYGSSVSDPTILSQRLDFRLYETRDGFLSGGTTLLGKRFDVEAFRVDAEGEPDNARPQRTVEVLQGLLIDDVPLNRVRLPGFEGEWIVVIYPGEDEQYLGPDKD
jgi:hypothetical protein